MLDCKFGLWIIWILALHLSLQFTDFVCLKLWAVEDLKDFGSNWNIVSFIRAVISASGLSLARFSIVSFEVCSSEIMQALNLVVASEVDASSVATISAVREGRLVVLSVDGNTPVSTVSA